MRARPSATTAPGAIASATIRPYPHRSVAADELRSLLPRGAEPHLCVTNVDHIAIVHYSRSLSYVG